MKILASDFDDTLYFHNDKERNLKNISKIKTFVESGNLFIIVTGRNYSSIKKYINKFEIPYSYLICDDGAKIFDKYDNCLNTTKLGNKAIDKIIPILTKEKANYYLDDGYTETDSKNECVKIVINCVDVKDKKRMVEIIKDSDIHIYASRTHVNIINKKVNKENAIRKLFELEELNIDNLHVIGDNDNDYQMLKAFKGGIIKQHNKILDELQKKEYESLAEFIHCLMEKEK